MNLYNLLFLLIFLHKPLNAARRVHKPLLTGEEGMTLGANLDMDILAGSPGMNNVTARAGYRGLFIFRMDSSLHEQPF